MEWDFTIQYKKGSEMPADYLSRNVVESIEISDEDLAGSRKTGYRENWEKSLKSLCWDGGRWGVKYYISPVLLFTTSPNFVHIMRQRLV